VRRQSGGRSSTLTCWMPRPSGRCAGIATRFLGRSSGPGMWTSASRTASERWPAV
jgi:hypothetical protein